MSATEITLWQAFLIWWLGSGVLLFAHQRIERRWHEWHGRQLARRMREIWNR
jgi:hypothetical protein